MQETHTYLALGDSYTIGESVQLDQSFPYQVVQHLRKQGFSVSAPEILAKTGWTTDELEAAMKTYLFLSKYDFVTVLIGVNNQYRGRDIVEYKTHFEELLQKAIGLANAKKERVIVVSIPDYSITPFASSMDKEKIAKEIDMFNGVNKAISIQYKVNYVDITTGSKEAANNPELISGDSLHPSGKEYAKWANRISPIVMSHLKK